jgi:hypothetical protein
MIFLHLEVDGDLKLFNYYGSNSCYDCPNTLRDSTGRIFYEEKCILQKGDGELVRVRPNTFRAEMPQYFSDCTEIAQKIEDEKLLIYDLPTIVEDYNKNCK